MRYKKLSKMYPINRVRTYNDERQDVYVYECKNVFNQKLCLYFTDHERYYFITFYIMSKKKREFETLKQTGKDGLTSLLWAKNCIKDFIDNVAKKNDLIIVEWDDKKRKNVYVRGLKSLGFYIGRFDGKEVLMLKIK